MINQTNKAEIVLRFAEADDLKAIAEIDNTQQRDAWGLQGLNEFYDGDCTAIILAEHRNNIRGFIAYQINERRRSLRIAKVMVKRQNRGHGIGRKLVGFCQARLGKFNGVVMRAYVRETSASAQSFFKSLNFRAIKVKRAFFDDSKEDAYLFEWRETPLEP